ncbi:MAG: hypothetical protein A2172_02765 [Candidatus Woykebacteria bacterium RBG_13_40_15]|uniref:Right handed beta helix domain-containing protein n=1 Tax=Candidatus Woykebacteria bacterium RBG_13_40_15 TaxID=1802593 RepID=A0A1G1W8C0_9BACT|nr:MAG: hypothetical protein A2172_02765 [Candidatus Woykebacteria bacterium RBG_13_40_15]
MTKFSKIYPEQTRRNKTIIFLGIILAFLLLPKISQYVQAGDGSNIYWVSPTGTATWANCQSATDPGSNYCSLPTANSNIVAGDTVYLKGGAYTASDAIYGRYDGAISPRHSGTGVGSGRIIYAAASSVDPPILSMSSGSYLYGLYLGGYIANNYIKIDGIKFLNFRIMAYIVHYSSYNEITNCTFSNGGTFSMLPLCIGGSTWGCNVNHNWIHENTFSRGGGTYEDCIEGGDVMRIGPAYYAPGADAESNNHTIENNYFEYGGHSTLESFARLSVYRNNVFNNEPWNTENSGSCTFPNTPGFYTNSSYTGKYGHRNVQLADDWLRPAMYNLFEGNRLGYASVNPNNGGADNLDLSGPKQIVRYNSFYGSMNAGIRFKYGSGRPGEAGNPGAGGWGGVYNRVFNNTFYHSGYGYPFYETCQNAPYYNNTCPQEEAGVLAECYNGSYGTFGNILKNNIIYDSRSYTVYGRDVTSRFGGAPDSICLEQTNNWKTSNGNPLFTNPSLEDTSSKTLPNLDLQSSSAAINGGTYLTTANGSGSNSTSLVVLDALYFQDGSWGSDLARGVTLFPDWIAIGTVNNVVQISSINYSTNTIALASPMTWNNGASIWLYKKSDGSIVLSGSAPDYGAYEYVGVVDTTPPSPPQNVSVS